MSRCVAKEMQGKEFIPRAIGKIREDNFYIPDCSYYESRINIPKKVKIDEILTGWHCYNCKNFKED